MSSTRKERYKRACEAMCLQYLQAICVYVYPSIPIIKAARQNEGRDASISRRGGDLEKTAEL